MEIPEFSATLNGNPNIIDHGWSSFWQQSPWTWQAHNCDLKSRTFPIACEGSMRPEFRNLKVSTTANKPFPIAQFGLVRWGFTMEKAFWGGKHHLC